MIKPDDPIDPSPHEAFAALSRIESGDWDRYLLRLRAAIDNRRSTVEYELHIVVRKTLET